jgi:hypothetical protein
VIVNLLDLSRSLEPPQHQAYYSLSVKLFVTYPREFMREGCWARERQGGSAFERLAARKRSQFGYTYQWSSWGVQDAAAAAALVAEARTELAAARAPVEVAEADVAREAEAVAAGVGVAL